VDINTPRAEELSGFIKFETDTAETSRQIPVAATYVRVGDRITLQLRLNTGKSPAETRRVRNYRQTDEASYRPSPCCNFHNG
jgi:hypothetical protein